MSSLSQALSVALTGLQTSSALITLASNNISNSQTAGYTEKTATVVAQDYGSSFGGTSIASYSRATNQALTSDYNSSTSSASYSGTQNNYMSQVQQILDSTDTNPTLSADVANFSSAWANYASDPESTVQQEAVINSAKTLTTDIQTASAGIGTLTAQIQSDVGNNVNTMNADLQQIATTNTAIQVASTSGQPTVDLQDKLDTLVNQVSAYTTVSVQDRPNGQIAVFTPSGQLLVDGPSAQKFSWNGSAISSPNGTNVTSAFAGGSLQAATDFISTSASAATSATPGVGVTAKFQSQLSALVNSLTASSANSTSAFATAYTNAVTSSTGTAGTQSTSSVASSFFTVTNGTNGQPDPSTFAVNANLLSGSQDLPETGTQSVADSFNSVASYTASGLNAPGVSYSGLTSAILSNFQQIANTVSTQNTTAGSQQTYYQTTLSNATGVNIDTELANLVAYQNSYAASAHVISTVNQMLTTLMNTIS